MKKMDPAPKIVERVVGRGFTARVHREYVPADDTEQAKMAALWSALSDQANKNESARFAGVRGYWRGIAERILTQCGLPSQSQVAYRLDRPDEWSYTLPASLGDMDPQWGLAALGHYILRIRGIDHDAKDGAGFAAQIIEAARESERHEVDRALCGAFELGRLTAELRYYWFAAHEGARKAPPARTQPGREKARTHLLTWAQRNLEATEQNAWDHLKTKADDTESDGALLFDVPGHEFATWRISRKSFYRFWKEVKNRAASDQSASRA